MVECCDIFGLLYLDEAMPSSDMGIIPNLIGSHDQLDVNFVAVNVNVIC